MWLSLTCDMVLNSPKNTEKLKICIRNIICLNKTIAANYFLILIWCYIGNDYVFGGPFRRSNFKPDLRQPYVQYWLECRLQILGTLEENNLWPSNGMISTTNRQVQNVKLTAQYYAWYIAFFVSPIAFKKGIRIYVTD